MDGSRGYYFKNMYIFYIVIAAPGLSCGMWDRIPWPGIEPCTPFIDSKSLTRKSHYRLLYSAKEVRQRQILYDITYMWNLKYDTNERIYET